MRYSVSDDGQFIFGSPKPKMQSSSLNGSISTLSTNLSINLGNYLVTLFCSLLTNILSLNFPGAISRDFSKIKKK